MSASTFLYTVAPKVSGVKASRQKAIIDSIAPVYYDILRSWGIDTKQRIACFTGQTMQECDGYCTMVEYGNGSPTVSGGSRYKGRGPLQITHDFNYKACGEALGLDLINHPELLENPINGLKAACWFWKKNNLNKWADVDDIRRLGNAINRGNPNYNGNPLGHTQRVNYTNKAKQALVSEDINPNLGTTTGAAAVATGGSWAVASTFFHEHIVLITSLSALIILGVLTYYTYKKNVTS